MCSIFASTSKRRFLELIDLNQPRGKFSFSYSVVKNKKYSLICKEFGLFNKDIIEDNFDLYIGHCQAPTNGLVKDRNRIHPSKLDNQYLYHNGILKPTFLEKATINYNGWDTFYLNYLLMDGLKSLELVEGSFACIFIKNDSVYFFRNSLCPLFLYYSKDGEISISSVKFENSFQIQHGLVYKIFGSDYELEQVTSWNDKNLVYRR